MIFQNSWGGLWGEAGYGHISWNARNVEKGPCNMYTYHGGLYATVVEETGDKVAKWNFNKNEKSLKDLKSGIELKISDPQKCNLSPEGLKLSIGCFAETKRLLPFKLIDKTIEVWVTPTTIFHGLLIKSSDYENKNFCLLSQPPNNQKRFSKKFLYVF